MGKAGLGPRDSRGLFFARSTDKRVPPKIDVNMKAVTPSNGLIDHNAEHRPMKPSRITQILAVCTAALSLSAHAQPQPNAQWRATESTLFDLIQNGYGIVAVTSVAARSSGLPEDTYVLQKNNSLFRCVETRAAETGAARSTAPIHCAELVKPYTE
ncbi:hypothetical protein AWB76_00170 [Caballeronia temeraria]|uniref:Uncharacterized protein n=1 Tax=Caballeronia temeraria TaxID=1777137 RepID=A0A157Z4F5_9BURK|nr:hypothetical protein [Caballeronia temeraria]SAK40415.1 hypothetical protein AWB76_00170 [Caballeronia temeraria]